MISKIPQNLYKFVYTYVKRQPLAIFMIIFIDPLIAFAEKLVPWIISRVLNMVNSNQPPEEVWNYVYPNLWIIFILMFATFIVNLSTILYTHYKLSIENGVVVRKDLFKIVIEQSCRFWNQNLSGVVYNKLNILMRGVVQDQGLFGGITSIYHRLVNIVIILYFIAKIYLPLAVVFLICSILLTVALSLFSGNVEQKSKKRSEEKSKTSGKIVDMTINFFLIKTFGTKKKETKLLEKDLDKLQKASEEYQASYLNHTLIQQALALLVQIGLILYSVYLWAQQLITVGDVLYVVAILSNLILSFRIMGYIILGVKEAKGSMKSARATFNEEIEVKSIGKNLEIKNSSIEFKNVSFSYDNKKEILHKINLKISPQEKVGIVGLSGGGKTTLAHLLLRIYDTTSGQILIDGQNIKEVNLESLYKNIAFIPQDTSLFHRSIKENILYGTFKANNQKINKVAKQSYVDEFINKLPQGYDTLVGDKGVKLSGGQRQRVGIARAIFKNAPILVLDEATSALDSKSERYIQKSIAEIIKDKTVIAIAHRLSTLKEMDRIIVIDNGKIIEEGSPKKLLSKKGKFAKLWKIQMEL